MASGRNRYWFKLDNAGKIYPAVRSPNYASLFRATARLKEPVDPQTLQQALLDVMPRFPIFQCRIRSGVFWYYMETNPRTPRVHPDVTFPCQPMRFEENEDFMFRVLYYGSSIHLEVFHALSDGSGGLVFLKTLVAQYLRLKGHPIPASHGVLDLAEKPDMEEMEDAYRRYANFRVIRSRAEQRAYHLRMKKLPTFMLAVTEGVIPLQAMLQKARSYHVSMTELMAAVLLDVILDLHRCDPFARRGEAVKVSVPVNMRNYFPTRSLRNFSLYVNVGVDPQYGEYTFEEILSQVHHYMRYQLNGKFLNAQMCGNVASERNPVLRCMPLFIKNAALNAAYRLSGERYFTTTITNLGAIDAPPEMKPLLETIFVTLGPAKINPIQCAVSSYGDSLRIIFSSTVSSTALERGFFRRLVTWGIPVSAISNKE